MNKMTEIRDAVGKAVYHYAAKVVAKSRVEYEDAEQELWITAWETFHAGHPKSYAMSRLHFKHLRLIETDHRQQIRDQKLYDQMAWGVPFSEDHAPRITNEVAFNQELMRIKSTRDRGILYLRKHGMTIRGIADTLQVSTHTVRRTLKKY